MDEYEDERAHRYTATDLPPVSTSFDKLGDFDVTRNFDGINSRLMREGRAHNLRRMREELRASKRAMKAAASTIQERASW